jgi:hypothetical protein
MMTLTEYDGIWEVTYESLDDGHRLVADYFTTKGEADTFAREFRGGRDPRVVQTVLWHTADHPTNRQWFKFEGGRRVEVMVDRQYYRRSGLAKLSPQERRALGV